MKTLSYHTASEIKVGIWIALFTVAIFTTVKVKELQLNEPTFIETMNTEHVEVSHNSFPALPAADAKLIEEPMESTGKQAIANAASNNGQELALQLRSWVESSAYWSDEIAEEEELALQMKTWMNDGTYWSRDAEPEEPGLDLTMKSWINSGAYWSTADN